MFAKQTLSASLVALLAGHAAADPTVDPPLPAPGTDEAPPQHPSGTFQIGAGFSTDDGFLARARIAQMDLFRSGIQLSLDTIISARRQSFDLNFVDPHLLDSDVALGASLYNDQRQLPGFMRKDVGGTVALSRPIGDHLRIFSGYRLHQVSVDLDNVARGEASPAPLTIGSVYSGIEYSTLDAPYLPRHGTRMGVTFELAEPWLGSDVELATTRGYAETHQSLGPFTLHVGGSLAAIGGPQGVPLAERFFVTNSYQVRGYGPGGFGPANGGTVQGFGRAELEIPLFSSIQLSGHGFLDGGVIDHESAWSAGFGLVWRSPIGPLTFDWAFPHGSGPPAFVFGLGSTF